jgi:cell division protein FtsL
MRLPEMPNLTLRPKGNLRLFRSAGYIALGLLFLYNAGKLCLGNPTGLYHQRTVAAANAEMTLQNEALKQQISELKIQQKRLLTDSLYIEEIARTHFGMSRKGETVYYFLPEKK